MFLIYVSHSVCDYVCVSVLVYVRVNTQPPYLDCLKIVKACFEQLLVIFEDYFPTRFVCNTIIIDSR